MSKASSSIRVLLAVCIGALALFVATPAAHAQYANTPTLTVDDSNVVACEVAMITGTNFPANTVVSVSANGSVIGNATTDASGTFSFPWNTCGVAAGAYTVTASAGATVLSVVVNVSAGTATTVPSTGLPLTGSDTTLGLARLGAGLVAFGAIVVLVARRRVQAASA